MCHVTGFQLPNYGPDMTAFRTNVVNVSANRSQVPGLSYIKPNDVNNSFILYKVTGQQGMIPVGGAQMPYNLTPLTPAAMHPHQLGPLQRDLERLHGEPGICRAMPAAAGTIPTSSYASDRPQVPVTLVS